MTLAQVKFEEFNFLEIKNHIFFLLLTTMKSVHQTTGVSRPSETELAKN